MVERLRRAYRQLVQHNTSRALELIERDPTLLSPEVTLPRPVHHLGPPGRHPPASIRKLDDAADAD
jgi:hypothetical protein